MKRQKEEEDRMEVDVEEEDPRKEVAIAVDRVLELNGHEAQVFLCEWHPTNTSLLATSAGDSTARIWRVPEEISSSSDYQEPKVLRHEDDGEPRDITSLCWNSKGTCLATGSYLGDVCFWSVDGELLLSSRKHRGPVFSLRWSPESKHLLSAGLDKQIIVWRIETASNEIEPEFTYQFHSAAVLDVSWKDEQIFASCSTDRLVCVGELGKDAPVQVFDEHQADVNTVIWSPQGNFLASCSDDKTAKVWSLDKKSSRVTLKGHSKEIYTLTWSPNEKYIATASFDNTVKLWDTSSGKIVKDFQNHTQAVYSVDFSPNGKILASGGFDGQVFIYSVPNGQLLKTFRGSSGVFQLQWSLDGSRIAVTFAKNTVCVFSVEE